MLSSIFHAVRLSEKSKNFIIFLPLLFINNISSSEIIISILGFVVFFFVTNIIYVVNDFSDIKIDKFNHLKKNKFNYKISITILVLSIIALVYLFFYSNKYLNYFIILYFINFVFYNFFFKKKKYFDILFLTNFYIIRIYYAFEIHENINLSFGLVIFLYFFFMKLAFLKKIFQINSNPTKNIKKIICYDLNDRTKIIKVILILKRINFLILILFFFHMNLFNIHSLFISNSKINIFQFLVFFLYYLYLNEKINSFYVIKKKEIIKLFLSDKYIVISTLIFIILFILLRNSH